jgi:hypothetical protein
MVCIIRSYNVSFSARRYNISGGNVNAQHMINSYVDNLSVDRHYGLRVACFVYELVSLREESRASALALSTVLRTLRFPMGKCDFQAPIGQKNPLTDRSENLRS